MTEYWLSACSRSTYWPLNNDTVKHFLVTRCIPKDGQLLHCLQKQVAALSILTTRIRLTKITRYKCLKRQLKPLSHLSHCSLTLPGCDVPHPILTFKLHIIVTQLNASVSACTTSDPHVCCDAMSIQCMLYLHARSPFSPPLLSRQFPT